MVFIKNIYKVVFKKNECLFISRFDACIYFDYVKYAIPSNLYNIIYFVFAYLISYEKKNIFADLKKMKKNEKICLKNIIAACYV